MTSREQQVMQVILGACEEMAAQVGEHLEWATSQVTYPGSGVRVRVQVAGKRVKIWVEEERRMSQNTELKRLKEEK